MLNDKTYITKHLKTLLETDIPYQFVSYTGFPVIEKFCKEFNLPKPQVFAGNIVIGDLETCDFLLTAHMDEVSFGIKSIEKNGCWLAPYHEYIPCKKTSRLTLLGVRKNTIKEIGKGNLIVKEGKPFCKTSAKVSFGDRAVYNYHTDIEKNFIRGKAIDDRVGVLISLIAASEFQSSMPAIGVVLSDGEAGIANGYFSRNFPHVLPLLKKECRIIFIDGLYQKDLQKADYSSLPKSALVIHHSSFGKGYITPPKLFSLLRDVIIPEAKAEGIEVEICTAYRSRGDDWGMVTNPITGNDFKSLIIDFGTWGGNAQEVPLTVNIDAIRNCSDFIVFTLQAMSNK